jgi:acetyltransferase-like isoleucine patch superfamily enzyme
MLRSLIRRFKTRRKYRGIHLDPSTQLIGTGKFEYGPNCSVAEDCLFVLGGTMKIGSNVNILKGSEFECEDISIGNYTSVQRNSSILGKVKIGSYNLLGPNLYIASGTHQFRIKPELNIRDQDDLKHKHKIPGRKVLIDEDCWFGINVVVMEGVRIGKGCVIGANSLVTKDVPPYSVISGAPAKIISKRLAFVPPREIMPCDDHVPYFYEGFKTRVFERAGDAIRLSAPEFSVGVDIAGAAVVKMEVGGIRSIRSGTETFEVAGGVAEIPVGSLSMDGFLLSFSVGEGDWDKAEFKKIWAE